MKRTLLLAICTSILTVLATQLAFGRILLQPSASAVIPEIISYQGILNDTDGHPLNGNYELTVRIYNQESDGSALWEETHANVAVNNGLFNVMLGSVNPLTVAFDEPYYMGLSINGGNELTPRLAFASVATAFVAKVAYTLAPDAEGNITLGGNVDVEGKIGATEYCDENGGNCVAPTNLGGLAEPDFDSGWFTMQSQQGADSYKEILHDLGDYPSQVKVLVKAIDGANEGFIFEGIGSAQNDDDTTSKHYGGVVFAYNQTKIRIWAPDKNNDSSQGSIINIYDGWGGEANAQTSHTAEVKVLVWR